MKLLKYYVLALYTIQYIQCQPLFNEDISAITPFWLRVLKTIFHAYNPTQGLLHEKLPTATSTQVFDTSSDTFQDAIFYAKLSKSVNCRVSFDKWECDDCADILPDGTVVRGFYTFPLGVAGFVIRSEKKRTFYVIIRTDSNFRGKVLNANIALTDHPTIPNAKVQQGLLDAMLDVKDTVHRALTDQLQLYPDFNIHVVGHSFGAGVGSLLVTDLYQRVPKRNSTNLVGYLMGKPRVGNSAYARYVADNDISIKRFVEKADSAVHQPPLEDGYVHEGTEYWLNETNMLVHCPGQYETQNCSSSLMFTSYTDHLIYFGVSQDCRNNIYNIY